MRPCILRTEVERDGVLIGACGGIGAVCRVAAWLQERRRRADEDWRQHMRASDWPAVKRVEAVAAVLDEALAVCRQVAMEAARDGQA